MYMGTGHTHSGMSMRESGWLWFGAGILVGGILLVQLPIVVGVMLGGLVLTCGVVRHVVSGRRLRLRVLFLGMMVPYGVALLFR